MSIAEHNPALAHIRRLERRARDNPGGYRMRVLLLACLGYFYILMMLALAVAPVLGIIAILRSGQFSVGLLKLGIVLGAFAFYILSALWCTLWIDFPEPEGAEVRLEQVPRLVSMVHGLADTLKAPRPHRILVTNEFNACVAQVPRLGIFGWQKNFLVIGVPLMYSLSPQQFRAILAHELAHLSGNHSRFAGWLYRARMMWVHLLITLEEEEHGGAALFGWFFNWYAPVFMKHTFVLGRIDEYLADKSAAKIVGLRTMADALINTEIKARFLMEHFPEGPGTNPDDNRTFFHGLAGHLPADRADRWLAMALGQQTGYEDTHPALADRLRGLGIRPLPDGGMAYGRERLGPPPPLDETAADYFLPEPARKAKAGAAVR